MTSIEDRFQAAVNVIKGLPKNGPYQPSNTMMLKFYGYYKQATEGPCPQKKPSFWDLVGKAKWDAWNDNRYLTTEQAMQKYVEALREIIETMSYTENVQNFVDSLCCLDNINLDELELVAPGMRELAESHPNSPFNSRTNSPQHGISTNQSGEILAVMPLMNGHSISMEEEHESIDMNRGNITSSTTNNTSLVPLNEVFLTHNASQSFSSLSNGNVDQSDEEYGDPIDVQHELSEAITQNSQLLKQIQTTVLRMNMDVVAVQQRIIALEQIMIDIRAAQQKTKSIGSKVGQAYLKWWPFQGISPGWFAVLVMWPFILRRITPLVESARRK